MDNPVDNDELFVDMVLSVWTVSPMRMSTPGFIPFTNP